MTLPIGGSSSSSSSSDDRCEFHELDRGADEARQHYSDATREVSRLERCLDAIRVALEALERETTIAQAAGVDA
jgi:chromosome segregation ATPase